MVFEERMKKPRTFVGDFEFTVSKAWVQVLVLPLLSCLIIVMLL